MTTSSHPRPDRRSEVTPDDRARGDATHEFWGDQADWSTPRTGRPDVERAQSPSVSPAGRGTTVGRWLGLLTGARIAPIRTRTTQPTDAVGHEARPAASAIHEEWLDHADDPFEDTPETSFDDTWDERWETTSPPAPVPRSGVDPLLARFGGLAVIVTLLIPAFLGFTSGSDDSDAIRTATAPLQIAPTVSSATDGTAAATPPSNEPGTAVPIEPTTIAQPAAASTDSAGGTTPGPTTSVSTPPTAPTVVADEAVVAQALIAPSCPQDYEVVAGDFWIRLADESNTPLTELLDLNGATLDTALFPGGSVCLPADATIPPPPAPATPSTVTPSTAASTTPSARSQARTATGGATPSRSTGQNAAPPRVPAAPPVTKQPAPASTAGPAEVEAIIRAVWPDDLENRAIEIAQRESKLRPTAKNSCCYGVFQIYWSVHKSWLAGLGITSADQLYDPTLNARAALALYERAGSWGPWGG